MTYTVLVRRYKRKQWQRVQNADPDTRSPQQQGTKKETKTEPKKKQKHKKTVWANAVCDTVNMLQTDMTIPLPTTFVDP
jgi:hypothetical protein